MRLRFGGVPLCICVVPVMRLRFGGVPLCICVAMSGPGGQPDVNGVRTSWAQLPCDVACGNRGRRTTLIIAADRGGRGKVMLRFERTLGYLWRCGCVPLRYEGLYSMVAPR